MFQTVAAGSPRLAASPASPKPRSTDNIRRIIDATPLLRLYRETPAPTDVPLHTLEGLILRRMELLAHFDERSSAADAKSSAEIVRAVAGLLVGERFEKPGGGGTTLGRRRPGRCTSCSISGSGRILIAQRAPSGDMPT